MNRPYTLDDVETLRAKAGIRYEEAVELLDKYDGDTTRALIELEKRGRISPTQLNQKGITEEIIEQIKHLWHMGRHTRICVERQGHVLVNLCVLAMLLFLVCGPFAILAGLILVLLSGCNLRVYYNGKPQKNDPKTAAAEGTSDAEESSDDDDDDFPSVTIS